MVDTYNGDRDRPILPTSEEVMGNTIQRHIFAHYVKKAESLYEEPFASMRKILYNKKRLFQDCDGGVHGPFAKNALAFTEMMFELCANLAYQLSLDGIKVSWNPERLGLAWQMMVEGEGSHAMKNDIRAVDEEIIKQHFGKTRKQIEAFLPEFGDFFINYGDIDSLILPHYRIYQALLTLLQRGYAPSEDEIVKLLEEYPISSLWWTLLRQKANLVEEEELEDYEKILLSFFRKITGQS